MMKTITLVLCVSVCNVTLAANMVSPLEEIPDLVSYWSFDGNANDSVGGNHGTVVGATLVEGVIGEAYYFNGQGDHIEIADSPSLDITDEITITAWVKIDELDKRQVIIAKTVTHVDIYIIEVNPYACGEGGLNFFLDSPAAQGLADFCGNQALTVGQWHHVACVYDGSERKIYFDGQFDAGKADGGDIPLNDEPVTIGTWGSGGRFFHGAIDEVAIFDRALSEEEIRRIAELEGEPSLKHFAISQIEAAIASKMRAIDEINTALAEEAAALDALEEMIASGQLEGLTNHEVLLAAREVKTAMRRERLSQRFLNACINILELSLRILILQQDDVPPGHAEESLALERMLADVNGDGTIDLGDWAVVTQHWLERVNYN